jgi:Kef-type K+ transport system membrane component KefB
MNLLAGWIGVLGGVLSGAIIGLFFHRDDWVGGYGSFSRRMIRLGHISFFGIGFLNFALGLTFTAVSLSASHMQVAAYAMVVGAITMPLLCFLTAWRKAFRHLFFIPVISVLVSALSVVSGWPMG